MGKFIDLTGMVFGRLQVIEPDGKTRQNRVLWKCKCSCEKETIVTKSGSNLRGGLTKSCGCLRKEVNIKKKKDFGESSMNRIIRGYKRCARLRNLDYALTKDEFIEITTKNCYYCNCEPVQICKSEFNSGDYIYNGIDRKDPNQGYVYENCVPRCFKCNHAKSNLSEKEFYELIKKIYVFKNLSID